MLTGDISLRPTLNVSCNEAICCLPRRRLNGTKFYEGELVELKSNTMKSEVQQQLHMLHNPFANTTQQPKIPDGLVNDSLGFSTQVVTEVGNRTGQNIMHVLLFPGMNAGVVVDQCSQAIFNTRTYFIPGYTGSSSVEWGSFTNPATTQNVNAGDTYALWRIVSQGLQLKLLNPTEEDDGWWEAIRLSTDLNTANWYLSTTNNNVNRTTNGVLAPVELLQQELRNINMSNQATYSTGLLRDLHRIQFELHGQKDSHDFRHMKHAMEILDTDQDFVDLSTMECSFVAGKDNAFELIENYNDTSYDMVYIRLHCRPNTGTAPFLGSRFHLNCISNQEVHFEYSEREARFHTKSHSIGPGNIGLHHQTRRAQQNAAHVVK
jgi:hypothetical protein